MNKAKLELVNLDAGFVVCEPDVILPITNMYDEDARSCDKEDAMVVVAGTEEFGWLTIDLRELDELTLD